MTWKLINRGYFKIPNCLELPRTTENTKNLELLKPIVPNWSLPSGDQWSDDCAGMALRWWPCPVFPWSQVMGVDEVVTKWYSAQQKPLVGELLFSQWKTVLLWWHHQRRTAREGDSMMGSPLGDHQVLRWIQYSRNCLVRWAPVPCINYTIPDLLINCWLQHQRSILGLREGYLSRGFYVPTGYVSSSSYCIKGKLWTHPRIESPSIQFFHLVGYCSADRIYGPRFCPSKNNYTGFSSQGRAKLCAYPHHCSPGKLEKPL